MALSIFRSTQFKVCIFLLLLGAALSFAFLSSEKESPKTPQPFSVTIEKFRIMPLAEQGETLKLISKRASFVSLQEFVKRAYPEQPPYRHDLAHLLGEIVFEQHGFEGFGLCDSFLAFGCFHGAAFAAIRMHGLDPTLGDLLWEGCKKTAPEPGNCLHGLGHAIMVIHQYDALKAFQECGRIVSDKNDGAFWCQDGAAMENTARTMALSDDAGYYVDLEDPYYPCNVMPEEYEAVCVRNHVGVLMRIFSFTLEEVIDFCNSFDLSKTKDECILMLGSILVGESFENPEAIIQDCRKTEPLFSSCIFGGVSAFGMARQFARAEVLCSVLQDESERRMCWDRIQSFSNQ